MERIGGETMVLFSDLRERLETWESMRSIASLPGTFTTKLVKGITYHYFQATLPGGRAQVYLGPDSPQIKELIRQHLRGQPATLADEQLFHRLAAQVIAGGVAPVGPDMARVVARMVHSGFFRVGGVLVGTLAFQALGTHLGVTWGRESSSTQYVDLATDTGVSLAIPDITADVPAAIEALNMGFFPVPRLSHSEPSTSYAIRGKTLRIDLLTPARSQRSGPIFIRRLNAAAQPLKYLDYLIESPVSTVVISTAPCLVSVPQPARFALHKLIVSQERGSAFAAKREKDITQARLLLEILKADFPDEVRAARHEIDKRGDGWGRKMNAACKAAGISI